MDHARKRTKPHERKWAHETHETSKISARSNYGLDMVNIMYVYLQGDQSFVKPKFKDFQRLFLPIFKDF